MSNNLAECFSKGITVGKLAAALGNVSDAGKKLTVNVEDRARPYLDHVLEGQVDGPPTSVVAFVFSGKDPGAEAWRRFTLSKTAPYTYEVGVFPTPFRNGIDPLSPGVPPSSSRRR